MITDAMEKTTAPKRPLTTRIRQEPTGGYTCWFAEFSGHDLRGHASTAEEALAVLHVSAANKLGADWLERFAPTGP